MIDEEFFSDLVDEDGYMIRWKLNHKSDNWKVRKYIKGYNRLYMICRNGLVYNKKRERFLWPQQHKNGYMYVCLYQEGKRKNVYLHRLVAEYFSPNPHGFDCVFHADGDKFNNRASNIWWASRSLLQRKFDSENIPTLAALPNKRRRNNASKLISKIPTRYERTLQVWESHLRLMRRGTEEYESLLSIIKCYRNDLVNGLPIPEFTTPTPIS